MRVSSLGLKFRIVSRSRGQTAVDRFNYQSKCLKRGSKEVKRGSRHRGRCLLLPDGAPAEWVKDPRAMWSALRPLERQKNAQEARAIDLTLPRDVFDELVLDLAHAIFQAFAKAGLPVQIDWEEAPARDGGRNPHLHIMVATRFAGPNGWSRTKRAARGWNAFFRADKGREFRRIVAERMNLFFAAHNLNVRVDPRTNEDRGLPDPEPQLPRSVMRNPHLPQFGVLVDALDDRRAVRARYDAISTEATSSREALLEIDEQLALQKSELLHLAPGAYRARSLDLGSTIEDWAVLREVVGEPDLAIARMDADRVLVESGKSLVLIEPNGLWIEGEIEDAAGYLGSLVHDLGWTQIDLSGPLSRATVRLVRRELQAFNLDPIQASLLRIASLAPATPDLIPTDGPLAPRVAHVLMKAIWDPPKRYEDYRAISLSDCAQTFGHVFGAEIGRSLSALKLRGKNLESQGAPPSIFRP